MDKMYKMDIALYVFCAVLLANFVMSLLLMWAIGLFDDKRQENHAKQRTHREIRDVFDKTIEDRYELFQKEYEEYKREIASIDEYNKNLKQGESKMMCPHSPRTYERSLGTCHYTKQY